MKKTIRQIVLWTVFVVGIALVGVGFIVDNRANAGDFCPYATLKEGDFKTGNAERNNLVCEYEIIIETYLLAKDMYDAHVAIFEGAGVMSWPKVAKNSFFYSWNKATCDLLLFEKALVSICNEIDFFLKTHKGGI